MISRPENLNISEHTFFVLTLDDVLLRSEWGDFFPVSSKELDPEADLQVLDLCKDLGIKATLFIPAVIAEHFPKIIKNLSQKYFDIAAHGYRHENLKDLSLDSQRNLIQSSLESIKKSIDREVIGWRSPSLYIDSRTLTAIEQSKIRWCSNVVLPSWLRHRPFRDYGEKIEIPIVSSIDYNLYKRGLSPPKVLKRWLNDFEEIRSRKSEEVFTLLLHPYINVASRERFLIVKSFLQTIISRDYVNCMKCSDILKHKLYLEDEYYASFLRLTTRMRLILSKKEILWRLFMKSVDF